MVLSQESAAAFLARFGNFYDGVLRRMALDFPRDKSVSTAICDILARDKEASEAWVVCTLRIVGLREFLFREQKASFLVLSDGIKFVWTDAEVFVDFGTAEDKPEVDDVRSAGFYLSGRQIEWSVRPLGDDEWR